MKCSINGLIGTSSFPVRCLVRRQSRFFFELRFGCEFDLNIYKVEGKIRDALYKNVCRHGYLDMGFVYHETIVRIRYGAKAHTVCCNSCCEWTYWGPFCPKLVACITTSPLRMINNRPPPAGSFPTSMILPHQHDPSPTSCLPPPACRVSMIFLLQRYHERRDIHSQWKA